jgi:putative redox protein
MEMRIYHEGGMRVSASCNGLTIKTDQSIDSGGGGEYPEPFTLMIASIGTCAGIYVYRFCQERDIPTKGIELHLKTEEGADQKPLEAISIEITLPEDFPEKYRRAIVRVADMCTVKRLILNPPEFRISVS